MRLWRGAAQDIRDQQCALVHEQHERSKLPARQGKHRGRKEKRRPRCCSGGARDRAQAAHDGELDGQVNCNEFEADAGPARVASMGGWSWSYGELPRASAIGAVGSSGIGVGLRLRLMPQYDGSPVRWQLHLGWRVAAARRCRAG